MKAPRNYFKYLTNSPAISSNDLLETYLKVLAKARAKAISENDETALNLLKGIEEEVERNMEDFLFNPYKSQYGKEKWYHINKILDSSKEKEVIKEDNISYISHLLKEEEKE